MRLTRVPELVAVILLSVGLVACDGDTPTDLDDVTPSEEDIVGAWLTRELDNDVAFLFLADGQYVQIENGPADENGGPGIERASYSWSQSTSAFTSDCPTVDTNGEWGFSHPNGAPCSGIPASMGVKAVAANGSLDFIPEDGDAFSLFRIADETDDLAGGWVTESEGYHIVLVFLDGSTYIHAEDGDADVAGQTGFEQGTYVWDGESGAFSTTCPETDTNGEWGLSHPNPDQGCTGVPSEMGVTATVDGDSLTFDFGDGETMIFQRVTR